MPAQGRHPRKPIGAAFLVSRLAMPRSAKSEFVHALLQQSVRSHGRPDGKPLLVLLAIMTAMSHPIFPRSCFAALIINGRTDVCYFSSPPEVPPKMQSIEWTVSLISDNQWHIRVPQKDSTAWNIGCDGTNIYAIFRHELSDGTPAAGYIYPGIFPAKSFYYETLPWLAFCSTPFLDRHAYEVPLPWRHAATQPLAHITRTHVTRFSSPPRLPKRILFVTDAGRLKQANTNHFLRYEALQETERAWRSVDFSTVYPQDMILGDYKVDAITNIANLTLPLFFQLQAFDLRTFPSKKKSPNRWEDPYGKRILANSATGKVTSIMLSASCSPFPTLPRRADVADFRLQDRTRGIECVSYSITNRQWKTDVDESLRRLLLTKTVLPDIDRKAPYGSFPFIALMAALSLLLALAIFFGTNKRSLKHGL